MSDALEITDPHVHIWDLGTGLYPRRMQRLRDGDPTVGTYLVDELLRDAGAIRLTKAVHVEGFPGDGLAEARHVQSLADGTPGRIPQAIVAHADLADPALESTLRALRTLPNVRGIRHALHRSGDSRDLLSEPAWRTGYGLLGGHGLSFDLQLAPAQALRAADLIAVHPKTPVAVNHMAWPKDRDFDGWRAWRDGLRALSRLPHVSIKVSGPGMFDPIWTTESLRPYAFEALDAFGPTRVMFASNFPVDRAWSTYARLWDAFHSLVAALPAADQARLIRGNADAFYRI